MTHQDEIAQLGCTREQLDRIMPKNDDIAGVSQQERKEVEVCVCVCAYVRVCVVCVRIAQRLATECIMPG